MENNSLKNLVPKTLLIKKQSYYSDEQVQEVVSLHAQGYSLRQIKEITHMPRRVARHWINQYRVFIGLNPISIDYNKYPEETLKRLISMKDQGYSAAEITNSTGVRSPYNIITSIKAEGIGNLIRCPLVLPELIPMLSFDGKSTDKETRLEIQVVSQERSIAKKEPGVQRVTPAEHSSDCFVVGEIEYTTEATAMQAALSLMKDSLFPVTIYQRTLVAIAVLHPAE
jgi:hypothetical protein